MRERVAHHQYAMLLGVHALRGQMHPPPSLTYRRTPENWFQYGKLKCRQVKPNPIGRNLWEHVLYKPKNRKHKHKMIPTPAQQVHDHTSLLLSCPLTQHTTQRILHAVESPDYHGVTNELHRCQLIEHLLAPFYRAQCLHMLWVVETAIVEMGNQCSLGML